MQILRTQFQFRQWIASQLQVLRQAAPDDRAETLGVIRGLGWGLLYGDPGCIDPATVQFEEDGKTFAPPFREYLAKFGVAPDA